MAKERGRADGDGEPVVGEIGKARMRESETERGERRTDNERERE